MNNNSSFFFREWTVLLKNKNTLVFLKWTVILAAFWNVLVQLKDIAYSFPFMKHSLLPSSANSDQYSDSCEDEDSDRSSEKEEQEDPADYCKGRGEVVQQSTLSSEWLKC